MQMQRCSRRVSPLLAGATSAEPSEATSFNQPWASSYASPLQNPLVPLHAY